jgi:SAM-dependent methyltransferase
MVRLFQPSSDIVSSTGLELPTRLLKQVLVGHGLRFGSRVLVAGCGHGELVAFLDEIAYQVDVIDDSSDKISEAQAHFPQFDFRYARLDESIPAPADEFDLILVQDLCVYRQNLLDLSVRTATANLLACLKPGGDLVFVRKKDGMLGCGAGHQCGCWKRHLACFPGQLELKEYRESFLKQVHWDWLFGTREHSHYFTVTLQSPTEKLQRTFWRDFARRGLMTGQGSCCPSHYPRAHAIRRVA